MKKPGTPGIAEKDIGERLKVAALREKAEGLVKNKLFKTGSKFHAENSLHFFRELEVHMIELELQSEELMVVQEQLKTTTEKYIKLYDYAPTGYLRISKTGEILEVNMTASTMLGKERKNLMNNRFGFFLSDDTKPGFNHFLDKVFSSKTKESCELTLSRNGCFFMFVTIIGIIAEKGDQCLINMIDNTGRKQAEESLLSMQKNRVAELLIANNELAFQNKEKGKRADELVIANSELLIQHLEKEKRAAELLIANTELAFQNVEKGKRADELVIINKELSFSIDELNQFAYINNHDLQEPLRTLTHFTQLLYDEYLDRLDEDGKKYIEFIHGSALRMSKMVRELFEYSLLGKESVKAMVNCNQIVDSVLCNLDDKIRKNKAKIAVSELPTLLCYETEIRLLFQNLLTNAIKFRVKDSLPEIHISAADIGKEWLFAIADNGIGIDEKHKDKIFIIFQRLHNRNKFEGTGIGLAHCKKIVELHGGRIWVDSMPGAGSIFKFTIPKN